MKSCVLHAANALSQVQVDALHALGWQESQAPATLSRCCRWSLSLSPYSTCRLIDVLRPELSPQRQVVEDSFALPIGMRSEPEKTAHSVKNGRRRSCPRVGRDVSLTRDVLPVHEVPVWYTGWS